MCLSVDLFIEQLSRESGGEGIAGLYQQFSAGRDAIGVVQILPIAHVISEPVVLMAHNRHSGGHSVGERDVHRSAGFNQAVRACSKISGAVKIVKGRRFSDDVDAATRRVLAEQCALGSPQYLNALKV